MLDFSDRQPQAAAPVPSAKATPVPAEGVVLPEVHALYRHHKGGLYRVEGFATLEATLEPAVLYRSIDPEHAHTLWSRPASSFVGEIRTDVARFARVPEAGREALDAVLTEKIISRKALEAVLAAHDEAHRFYHTREHVYYVFEQARRHGIELSREQALALLYHDSVYLPGAPAGTNEQLSALRMRADAAHFAEGIDLALVETIIRDTSTHQASCPESAIVQDLDLSALAAEAVLFCAHNELVWLENRHLLSEAENPRKDFDTRRLRFLLVLANRGPLFAHLTHLEDAARMNIEGLRQAWTVRYGKKAES